MHSFIFVVVVVGLASLVGADSTQLFDKFKAKYNRIYSSESEEIKRRNIFNENMKLANALMETNPYAKFGGDSPFADQTADEFKSHHNANSHFEATTQARGEELSMSSSELKAAAGKQVDWRAKGAVTYVKNQGQCGSCWSFSTTGGIEGQWQIAGNELTALSEQELVSCDSSDSGCNGGIMQNAFKWLLEKKDGKIVTEKSYPYVSGWGNVPACSSEKGSFGAQITGHVDIRKNETDMAAWVYANGPLSIAVDATTWQTYMGGIVSNCASSQLDHGVLIVGFDDSGAQPYWIVKNSWGPGWGESGYIRLLMYTDQCLITGDPTSSTVSNGPTSAPTHPTPPTPKGSFTSKRCSTPDCTNCHNTVNPQKTCITSGPFSFVAECVPEALIVKEYGNADCTGSFNLTSQSINVCAINFGRHGLNTYNEIVCPSVEPTPPTPPMPPTVSPVTPPPSNGTTFTQKVCSNAACTSGCHTHTFPQNTCLELSGGGSAKAVCGSGGLKMTEYPLSSRCTGFSIPINQPIDQCLKDTSGSYIENLCSNAESLPVTEGAKLHTTGDALKKVGNMMK